MTVIADLLDMIEAALLGPNSGAPQPTYATDARTRVYRPGDWPTQSDQYPVLKIGVPRDTKMSRGRSGAPQFTTVTTCRITGEVSKEAEDNDAGAGAALAALLRLQRQVEVAIVNGYPLTSTIQQIASIDSQFAFEAAETHLAGVQIDLALEYNQEAEDFAPIEVIAITSIKLTASKYPPAGFIADLQT